MRRPIAAALAATATAVVLLATACTSSDTKENEAPPASATATPSATLPASESAGPIVPDDSVTGGLPGFFDPGSNADEALRLLRKDGEDDKADLVQMIADQPIGIWLGNWTADPTLQVKAVSINAVKASQIPIFIVYNIPGRDCGLYSAGGLPEDRYLEWIQKLADGVQPDSVVWFILEPDALPQLGACDGQGDRAHLLSEAARILDEAGGRVFIDAGHSSWQPVETMAERIALIGTEHLSGFSTNTSNYQRMEDEEAWGMKLSELTGLPFITDTSRSGNGPTEDNQWCNPRGRALGVPPEIINPDGPLIAHIWGKVPGESDGTCNGGPSAGVWWEEIALELAQNAKDNGL